MKIPKLLTLSQFIEYLDNPSPKGFLLSEESADNIYINAFCFKAALRYNQFLKQPLTKDMFVCEAEKPTEPTGYDNWREGNGGADGIACVNYQQQLSKYEAAQNKVIFDGHIDEMKYFVPSNGASRRDMKYLLFNDLTLHDLAEATNGELILKNVEL